MCQRCEESVTRRDTPLDGCHCSSFCLSSGTGKATLCGATDHLLSRLTVVGVGSDAEACWAYVTDLCSNFQADPEAGVSLQDLVRRMVGGRS